MSNKDIAIRVENISKRYRIGLKKEMHDSFAGAIFDFIKRPLSNYRKYRSLYKFDDSNSDSSSNSSDIIWALKNVSFEIKKGEVVGIIGNNGAGKSTLLKVLSRITHPTGGKAEMRGRITCLLEVGTGFHPELTGRENIYLNGIILGMRKRELEQKYDEIVDFARVGKFIDTPVKRYSSGMKVRLAFSVAAHVEPDIMLVDEVLAVGDVTFQKKCLGKMNEVAAKGRTVIFVSHNLGAIENLCTTGIWIDDGRISMKGEVSSTISAYLKNDTEINKIDSKHWKHYGTGEAQITEACLLDANLNHCNSFKMEETLIVEFGIEFKKFFSTIELLGLEIKRAETGLKVLHLLGQDSGFRLKNISKGKKRFLIKIPNCKLYPGSYLVSIWVGDGKIPLDYVKDILGFLVVQSSASMRTTPFYRDLGVYHQSSFWEEIYDENIAK